MKRCEFYQEDVKGYDQYRSAKYPQWILGFSRRGRILSGIKSANCKSKCSYFLRYQQPNAQTRKHRRNLRQMLGKLETLKSLTDNINLLKIVTRANI